MNWLLATGIMRTVNEYTLYILEGIRSSLIFSLPQRVSLGNHRPHCQFSTFRHSQVVLLCAPRFRSDGRATPLCSYNNINLWSDLFRPISTLKVSFQQPSHPELCPQAESRIHPYSGYPYIVDEAQTRFCRGDYFAYPGCAYR